MYKNNPMKYKKGIIVILFILLLAGIGYVFSNKTVTAPKLSVKSDDSRVELSFTKKDLPEGIDESDVSIKKMDIENASKEIRAFYSFKPDGLVFNKPVTVTFHTDYVLDSTSMLFHIVSENLEPVHNPRISVNKEKTEQTIVAEITSFSNYILVDGIFGVSSIDPGVKRVGEIFREPINVRYPNTRDIILTAKFSGTNNVLTWKMRLKEQLVSGIWTASYTYDPVSVIDSPPLTAMSGGSFTHNQEFKCVSPGDGFIAPDVQIQYHYNLLDESNNPGPLFIDGAFAKLWLTGKCEMPSAENLNVETKCGGSVTITGNLNKYQVETDKVKVFIKKAGTNGAFVSFDNANYTINGGKFTYTTELAPGKYEYGVSALMIGAYTNFPVSEKYEFDILPCPEGDTNTTSKPEDTIPKNSNKDTDTIPKVNYTDPNVNVDTDVNAKVNTNADATNASTDSCGNSPGKYGFPVYDSNNLPNDCRAPENSSGWDCYTFKEAACNPSLRCFCITPPEYL